MGPPFKEMKWVLKEKRKILDALKDIDYFDASRDLLQIQRQVPHRSIAEIEKLLKDLSADRKRKETKGETEFEQTLAKRWIESCDKQSGVSSTCAKSGDGTITTSHPALAVADLMEEENSGIISFDVSPDKMSCDFSKIHLFIKDVLSGKNPFDNWTCNRQLESAVLMELINDLQNELATCAFDKQHEYLFHKYRESGPPMSSDEFKQDPFPDNITQSRFLNPLEMSQELSQCIAKRN